MKKLLLLLAITGSALYSIAQPSNKYVHHNWSKYVRAALNRNNSSQLKTTAVHERLKAFSIYTFDGTGLQLTDSTNYTYSNARGSAFDHNTLQYDDNGSSTAVMFDSSAHYTDQGSGIGLSDGKKAGYNSNNIKTSYTELNAQSGTLVNGTDHKYIYNSAGKIAAAYSFSWNTSASKWDSTDNILYAYNSSNQLIADSSYSYLSHQLTSKTIYTLDGSGNQLQIDEYNWNNNSWEPTNREIHTYYTSNNLKTNISQNYDNNAWVNDTKDSFGYSTGNLYNYHLQQSWNADSSKFINQSMETRTLNTGGTLVTQQVMKNWDNTSSSWADGATLDWTYNTSNNPELTSITIDLFGTPIEVAQVHYYYEQYNDLHVADAAGRDKITVYPNPAINKVQVSWNNTINANVSVINMLGQAVYAAQVNGNKCEIPVANLQPGVYRVVVNSEKDGIQFNQAIIKQ